MGTDLMKLATKQALMQNLAQLIAFMQQAKNNSLRDFPLSLNLVEENFSPYRQGLTLLLVLGLCSCGSLKAPGLRGSNLSIGSNVTPIQKIKPEQANQAVYIQGKVAKQAPLMKRWAYQINDSTGAIWVVTNQSGLAEGAEVVIKGKIRYKSIPLAGKELGEVYLEEE